MHVAIDDRYWKSGLYFYEIPMSKKLAKSLRKLDKAGLIPGGVDALVELIAQETMATVLLYFYDPLCIVDNGEHCDCREDEDRDRTTA
ncbi:hypothetical protein [Thalassobaculum sp.]|uniref:hypothetical protein n=1 Tax=Thalassobaculum sp. TaxID=2022740 RepID=UPI003B5CF13F